MYGSGHREWSSRSPIILLSQVLPVLPLPKIQITFSGLTPLDPLEVWLSGSLDRGCASSSGSSLNWPISTFTLRKSHEGQESKVSACVRIAVSTESCHLTSMFLPTPAMMLYLLPSTFWLASPLCNLLYKSSIPSTLSSTVLTLRAFLPNRDNISGSVIRRFSCLAEGRPAIARLEEQAILLVVDNLCYTLPGSTRPRGCQPQSAEYITSGAFSYHIEGTTNTSIFS